MNSHDKINKVLTYYNNMMSKDEEVSRITDLDRFVILMKGITESSYINAHLMNFLSLYLAYDNDALANIIYSRNNYAIIIDENRVEIDKL